MALDATAYAVLQTLATALYPGRPRPPWLSETEMASVCRIGEILQETLDLVRQHEQQLADIESITSDTIERQRETIEALLVENEDLRAKLYIHDRKEMP
jgi:hypothetical protein